MADLVTKLDDDFELVAKLERNALFYEREATALLEDETRRDRRRLGGREAKTIAELLRAAVAALRAEK